MLEEVTQYQPRLTITQKCTLVNEHRYIGINIQINIDHPQSLSLSLPLSLKSL